jgi:hypothetical protein
MGGDFSLTPSFVLAVRAAALHLIKPVRRVEQRWLLGPTCMHDVR